jgi:steroid Delta-isomerase
MDPVVRHETLFNQGVRTGDFAPWLTTFHEDAVATFAGLPLGPFHGRDEIAKAYSEHPPSSTMRVVESTVDGDAYRCRFVWTDAPDTGGVFVIRLRDDKLVSLDVTLDAPPPPR